MAPQCSRIRCDEGQRIPQKCVAALQTMKEAAPPEGRAAG
jgi:hypothetical protein